MKAARLCRCSCDAKSMAFPGGPISPLACFFPDRATPELQRLHAELGSRHSFREAARLMQCFLPCHPPHHMTVRNGLGRISERLEQASRFSGDLADAVPKGGLTVFLDGATYPLSAGISAATSRSCGRQDRKSGYVPAIWLGRQCNGVATPPHA